LAHKQLTLSSMHCAWRAGLPSDCKFPRCFVAIVVVAAVVVMFMTKIEPTGVISFSVLYSVLCRTQNK